MGGGVRQVVSPTLPFPLSLSSPFHSPYILSLPVGGKVRSSEGGVPRLPPPTNTTLMLGTGLSVIETLSCVQVVSVGEASPVSLVFQDQRVPLVQLVRLVIKFR